MKTKLLLKSVIFFVLIFTLSLNIKENASNELVVKICNQKTLAQSSDPIIIDSTCPPAGCGANGNVVCHGCDKTYRKWIAK